MYLVRYKITKLIQVNEKLQMYTNIKVILIFSILQLRLQM